MAELCAALPEPRTYLDSLPHAPRRRQDGYSREGNQLPFPIPAPVLAKATLTFSVRHVGRIIIVFQREGIGIQWP